MTDSSAFWQLVEEHRASLWRFSLGLTRSREEARDLMSETVLAAHRSFTKLRDVAGFRKSLFTIALRIHKRQRWRGRIFSEMTTADDRRTEDSNESGHDLELLLEAVNSLPAKQREAILLFEISGLSLEEVRVLQGGSLSGVKTRLARGREALRVNLADDETAPAVSKAAHSKAILLPFG